MFDCTKLKDPLDRAIAEVLYMGTIHSYYNVRSNVYTFSFKGKTFNVSLLDIGPDFDVSEYLVEKIKEQVGSIEGCKRMLSSFASCEVNRWDEENTIL